MKKVITKNKINVDVVVVGAGPAGLTAAIAALARGVKVLVLEKNKIAGKKLRITGGGRCNITNQTPNVRELMSVYRESGKYLFSTFVQFDVTKTRSWLESIGINTVEEAEQRVFPMSQSAEMVADTLLAEFKKRGGVINYDAAVIDIKKQGESFVLCTKTMQYVAKKVVLATGGVARPETGSTGDALSWLSQFGLETVETDVSLVPVAVKEQAIVKRLAGVALSDASVSIWSLGKRVYKERGKVLFTHVGMSGPAILRASAQVRESLPLGAVELSLDLLPGMSEDELENIFLERLMSSPNKQVQNQWQGLLTGSCVVPVCDMAGIDPKTPSHSCTVDMRRKLVSTVKKFSLQVSSLLGEDKAIISSGGLSLKEVDFRTMELRSVSGLYVVGDILNIDRPSGGYSLQLCWTTGFVAGTSVGNAIMKSK